MQAFLVLLRYDLGQMGRSWIVRAWIVLLVVPAVFLVGVALVVGGTVLFVALGIVGNLPGGFLYAFSPRSSPV